MKYDTAGNQIIELIQNCDCGLTCGCKKCNPLLWQKDYDYNWGEQKKKEIKEWKVRFDEDMEKRRIKFFGKS